MVYQSEEFFDLLKAVIVDEYRHPLYELSVEHEQEMSVHVNGTKPKKLLERKRPREEQEVADYRIESYEPITMASSDKSLHIIQKIFSPGLSSITWKDEDKNRDVQELKKYTFEYYPKYNSIQNFNKEVLMKKVISDPNGIAAVKPSKIPTSQTQTIRPIVVTYGSAKVWSMVENDYYLINVGERKDQDKNTIYVFEYYDTEYYSKFEAYVQKNSQQTEALIFTPIEKYPHKFKDKDGYGEVPAWPLKGISEALDSGDIFYKSFFYPAVPYWNLAVTHESDLFGAFINHLHPIRTELAQECDYVYPYQGSEYRCRAGKVMMPIGESITEQTCPGCQGTGLKSVKSPYGVYQFNKEKLAEDGGISRSPVEFVTVPTEPTRMLDERVDKMLKRGMWAINMDVEDKIGENQSGIAKEIDRSAQRDTLADVATLMFDYHLQNEYYFINKYMFATEADSMGKEEDGNLPQINKPSKFVTSSPAELLAAYESATKAGVSGIVTQIKQVEYVSQDLSTNPELKEYALTILSLDPLPGLSVDDINVSESKGFVSKQSAVIHFNLKEFVDRAIFEHSDFVSMTKDQKSEILKGYADEHIKNNKPTLQPSFPIQNNNLS